MKNMKKILALVLSVLMLLSLCACGAQRSKVTASPAAVPTPAPPTAQNSYLYADEMPREEPVYAEYAMDAAAGLAMTESAAMRSEEKGVSSSGGEAPEEDPAKIIYAADVTVETTAFDDALAKVSTLVERFGGWIESSSVNGANYYDISRGRSSARSAGYTLRIPGERFDELMGSLTELGNVPYTHVYTENVTAQYYDTQARMTAYQTQEARLLEMMEAAESVEDIILIEDRLTELRWQIESLQSSLQNWDRRVNYSTIYLQLNEVREYTPDTPVQLRYGERLVRAFRDGLSAVGRFFRDFLLWLVEALPTLVILAVLLIVLLPLARKLARRAKARRAARREAKARKKQGDKPTATPL